MKSRISVTVMATLVAVVASAGPPSSRTPAGAAPPLGAGFDVPKPSAKSLPLPSSPGPILDPERSQRRPIVQTVPQATVVSVDGAPGSRQPPSLGNPKRGRPRHAGAASDEARRRRSGEVGRGAVDGVKRVVPVPADPRRVAEERANEGNAKAQTALGLAFQEGRWGVSPDAGAAREWYGKAAEQGEAVAQHNLAMLWAAGQGGPQDPKEAARWYRRAAEQGFSPSAFALGILCATGALGPQETDAPRWYAKAANLGHAGAQVNLALLYDSGAMGVDKDAAEARRWYEKAAGQGHPKGQYAMGVRAEEAGDYAEAARWYERSADQGYGPAQAAAAVLYANGQGVAKDLGRALHLATLAAQGAPTAKQRGEYERLRAQYASRASPEQLVAASGPRGKESADRAMAGSAIREPSVVATGVFVSPDGLVVTSASLLDEAGSRPLRAFTWNGEEYVPQVVKRDLGSGVLVLRLAAKPRLYLPIVVATPQVGDRLTAVSFLAAALQSGQPKVAATLVEKAVKTAAGYRYAVNAQAEKGAAGAPLMDARGNLVGLLPAGKTGEGVDHRLWALPAPALAAAVGPVPEPAVAVAPKTPLEVVMRARQAVVLLVSVDDETPAVETSRR